LDNVSLEIRRSFYGGFSKLRKEEQQITWYVGSDHQQTNKSWI